MTRPPASSPLALALLITLSLAACNKAPPPPPAPPAAPEPPAAPQAEVAPPVEAKPGAALSVAGVEIGTAVAADMKVTNPSASFAPGDTIIAAITLHNAGTPTVSGNVGARWTGPGGAAINEESQQKDFAGDTTVDFRIAEPKGFKPGSYKLEVSLNGSAVETREFTVK